MSCLRSTRRRFEEQDSTVADWRVVLEGYRDASCSVLICPEMRARPARMESQSAGSLLDSRPSRVTRMAWQTAVHAATMLRLRLSMGEVSSLQQSTIASLHLGRG